MDFEGTRIEHRLHEWKPSGRPVRRGDAVFMISDIVTIQHVIRRIRSRFLNGYDVGGPLTEMMGLPYVLR